MITQNLFSTRPKTFMDYAPGKVPSKNDIKLTGYKDNNGTWKISAKMDDTYDFSELMTGMGKNGIGIGTLANDVAYFSEKIGAITPYNIYVVFNIER